MSRIDLGLTQRTSAYGIMQEGITPFVQPYHRCNQ